MKLTEAVFLPYGLAQLASQTGEFAQSDLEIESLRVRSSGEQLSGLVDGRIDMAITALDNLFVWNAKSGRDFRAIAQIEASTVMPIYARADYAGIGDLANARLAVDAPDSGFVIVLRHILERHGIPAAEHNLVPVGGVKERFEALAGNRADVGLLGAAFGNAAVAAGLRKLGLVTDFLPDLPGLVIVVLNSRLGELRSRLHRFLAALDTARQYILRRPEDASGELRSSGFDPAATAAVIDTCASTLMVSRKGFALAASMREGLGLLPTDGHQFDRYVDNRFFQESSASLRAIS